MNISPFSTETILILALVVFCVVIYFQLDKIVNQVNLQREVMLNYEEKLRDIPSKLEELEVRIVILEDK